MTTTQKNLKLDLEYNLILELKSPLMRGLKGANILSKIKDLVMNYPSTKLLTSSDPVINLIKESTIKKTKIETTINNTKDRNDIVRLEAQLQEVTETLNKATMDNIDLLFSLQAGNNNLQLSFEVLSDILDYYKDKENIDVNLTNTELYTENDINSIIKFIAGEERNNLSNFLSFIP